MIQRIQTVFLFLAAAALGLFLYMPLISMVSTQMPPYSLKGYEVTKSLPFNGDVYIYYFNLILTGTAIGLSLINIFLFSRRSLQVMMAWFSIILIASAEGFVYYIYYTRVYNGEVYLTWWNVLAIAALLLEILAIIYIRKDEETIRSLDRLR